MKKIIVILICLFCFACASANRASYRDKVNSWMGYNIESLTNSWGYPHKSFTAPNGNKVYVYEYRSEVTIPNQYISSGMSTNIGNSTLYDSTTTQLGGQTFKSWCNTYFEVNDSNIIVRWRIEGDSCF